MIEGLKPYSEYKESGLSWLGSIPSHWDVRRMKLLLREIDSRSTSGAEQLLRVSQYTGVSQRKVAEGEGPDTPDTRAASLVGYKRVGKDYLVINIMLAWNGSMGVSPYDGIASPAYCVYKFGNDAHPWYYHELLRLPAYKGRIKTASTGVVESRLRLYSDDLGRIEALLPPISEQDAIVHFLNHANRRIELFIRTKKKLIALLNEQKQAVINRVVTRGLDSTARMKPSGLQWLGDVPSHWDILSLKSVCKIQSGLTLGNGYPGQILYEFPYLRVANVQSGYIDLSVVKTIRVPKNEAQRCLLQEGDVLMTEGGDADKLGRGCVWDSTISPCLHQNHVFAVRPDQSRLEPRFLSVLLSTHYARAYFQSTANQTTNLASTNKTKVGQFKMLLPSIEEQVKLLAKLHEETLPLELTIARAEQEISLLREYRTRLVADVVTGQVDVREAVKHLPADVEYAEPILDNDAIDNEIDIYGDEGSDA